MKQPRITFNGKEIQPRSAKGRYKKSGGRVLAIVLLLVFGVIGTYFTIGTYAEKSADVVVTWIADRIYPVQALSNIAPTVDAAETLQALWGDKLASEEAKVISDLEQCESGHNAAPLIQYDNNSHGTLKGKDIPSLGILRFKIGTVQMYEKQLYGKTLTEKEAILVALNDTAAEALATDVIFKVDGGLWNWSCATPEMGVRVGVIKELTK